MLEKPQQHHAKGQRQALDRLWLRYLADGGEPGRGDVLLTTPGFEQGIRSFNARAYFDAHERFELAWRASDYPDRLLPYALSKLGAACHHAAGSRSRAAPKLARDALAVLGVLPDFYATIDLGGFRRDLARWLDSPGLTRLELRRVP